MALEAGSSCLSPLGLSLGGPGWTHPDRRTIPPRGGGLLPSPRLGIARFVCLRAPGAAPVTLAHVFLGRFLLQVPSKLPTMVPTQERRGNCTAHQSCRIRSVPPTKGFLT